MPGTKIRGLFGFNRLSSDILFDIYALRRPSPQNLSARLLQYCTRGPLGHIYIFCKRTITISQLFQGHYKFSKLNNLGNS